MHSVDLLSQFVQLGLVDGLGGLLPFGGKFGVGMVEAALSAPLRPILPLGNMVALGFQQIDLIQIGLLAHLHDHDLQYSGCRCVFLLQPQERNVKVPKLCGFLYENSQEQVLPAEKILI